ncbi:hypothetical protein MCOR25_006058 [Pyricularia grisea]|nr:hypothetical protein MCOR25_006058 [Pyricularia grisea]
MAPNTSAIHILDFPTEVLSSIFGFVKFDGFFELDGLNYFENLTQNTASIKSLRLVCIKFSTIATPLLLPVASCSVLDSKSLDVLDEISHHATFSSLVKVVHARIGFFDAVITKDPTNLATYLSWAWRKYSESNNNAPSALVDAVVDDWERLSKDPSSEVGAESLRILHSIHAEYKRRYLAQWDIHRSGTALRRLARAMARMPAATRLVIDDDRYRVPSHLGPLMVATVGAGVVDDSSLAALAAPMSWCNCWQFKDIHAPVTALESCHPPIDLVINLPVAVHQAGVALTCLRILNLQIPEALPAWDSGSVYLRPLKLSGREELREACQTLQVLEVTLGDYSIRGCCSGGVRTSVQHTRNLGWGHQPESEVQSTLLAHVVKLMLSKSLRHLHLDSTSLDFRLLNNENWQDDDFCEHMFGDHPLPNLEVLHLSNNALGDGEELIQLILKSEAIYQFRLRDVRIGVLGHPWEVFESGGWAKILEVLREQTPRMRENELRLRGWVLDETPVRIRSVNWSEISGSPRELYFVAQSLFTEEIDGFTAVEHYIRGATDKNPLVELDKLYPYDEWDNYLAAEL